VRSDERVEDRAIGGKTTNSDPVLGSRRIPQLGMEPIAAKKAYQFNKLKLLSYQAWYS